MTTDAASHAALMDRVYRHQRYIYDFTRKYYLFGRDRLIRELDLAPGQTLIEIGCGTGRNLVRIARRFPQARLFGLDASEAMLETAGTALRRAGLEGAITLRQGYAETLTPEAFGLAGGFDHIVFSYSLSMIPDWKQALTAAVGALKPGGSIHIVDFGDFEGLPLAVRRLLLRWLALFHVAPRTEILGTIATVQGESDSVRNATSILAGRYAFVSHSCKNAWNQGFA